MIAIRLVINGNAFWPAMARQCLVNEALGGLQVTVLAEVELDSIAVAIDGAIEILPLAFYLNVGFIQVPFTADLSLPAIEAHKQFGTEMNNPTMNSQVIHIDAALSHHFLQIA